MTITQQDRQLAERVLECRKEFTNYGSPHYVEAELDVEAIASLLAEAREAQHKASWLPIETAPQNVEVLLLTPAIPGLVTRERNVIEVGCASHGNSITGFSYHGYAEYWMPLPTPPITKEGV